METQEMGRVVVPALIENAGDMWNVEEGTRKPEEVRRVEVTDALVDTGATTVAMPKRLLEQLGFHKPYGTKRVKTTEGETTIRMYGPIRLTIQGRTCLTDVAEVAEHCPVLIGQIPLEALDWVVDLKNRRLIGNPEHNGEYMLEMY